ncbi:MAG: phosphoribosylglycinamide formyltransferase [Rudaea sp.]|nr:phosphoribosylglycinamide formyltransferase [Rudaea sp.]
MFNVVVLASGRGSNFAALLSAQTRGDLPIRLRALLSDKTRAPALDLARNAGIAALALPPREYPDRASFDRALFSHAAEFSPDLIVFAGFMRVIDPAVIGQWRGKAVNIHPSLLPKYPGLNTHARALQAGDSVHGASVHFVTAELDGGPVIAQIELPIQPDDSPDTLAARLLSREHRLLVAAVALLAQGRIVLGVDGVEFDGCALRVPLRLDDKAIMLPG